ncbi:MAG: OmpA family protein [Nannocystaceae bacterium]
MALRIVVERVAVVALGLALGCSDRPTSGSEGVSTSMTSSGSTSEVAESTTTEAAPACDTLGATPEDAAAVCGLAQVFFAAGEDALDARALCQLTAFAPCLVQAGVDLFILEAHASAGEAATEEASILLTDRRGQRVKEFLQQHGVDPNAMQVISYGYLEATTPSVTTDQRVAFRFQPW